MVDDPSTRRIDARANCAWLDAATEPSTSFAISSPFANAPSNAAQFLYRVIKNRFGSSGVRGST